MNCAPLIRLWILLPLLSLYAMSRAVDAGAAPSSSEQSARATRGAALPASPTLPTGDPAYEELDRLDALGLLPGEILGHRPLSLGEVAALLATAGATLEERGGPLVAREILDRLGRRFPAELLRAKAPRGYRAAAAGLSGSDQAPRVVPLANGLGGIEAATRPFYSDRGGGPFSADGATAWLEAGGGRSLAGGVAATLRGEVRLLDGPDDSPTVSESSAELRPRLLGASLRLKPSNIVLEIGRQETAWGPRPRGGFLVSRNTRPLDMILVSCERPWHFPGFLRYVGAVRQSLFLADLGGARNLPHTRLFAVRQTFRVTRHLELGFTESLLFGGTGAPVVSLGDFLYELIPVGGRNGRPDLSDHRYGMDGRIELWPGRLLAYGDVFIDDSRAPLYDYFHTLLAKRVGLAAPALGPGGRWEARAEYAHIPAIGYRHGRWFSGYTVDGRVLGDELGPDARGLRLELATTLPGGQRLSGEFSYEMRDRDTWAQEPTEDPDRAGQIFRQIDRPSEFRRRLVVTGRFPLAPGLDLLPRLGVERLTGALDETPDRTDHLLELGLEFRPTPG